MRNQLTPATKLDTYGWDIALYNAPSLASLTPSSVLLLAPGLPTAQLEATVIVDGCDGATLVVLGDEGHYYGQWHLAATNRKVAQHMARTLVQRAAAGLPITPSWLRAHGWLDSLN